MKRSTRITPAKMAEPTPLVAILAAGGATRFGGGKLDAPCAGKAVGEWVLDAAAEAGLAPGLIVTGPDTPKFAQNCGWTCIVNHNAADGLGTSLALAANSAQADARPLLVLLADMPLVSADYLRDLAASSGMAATIYPSGKRGVPALFPLQNLPDLARLSGDRGATEILSASADCRCLTPPENMLLDIDTPEDLIRAEAILLRRG